MIMHWLLVTTLELALRSWTSGITRHTSRIFCYRAFLSGQVIGLTMRLVLHIQFIFPGMRHSTSFAPGCALKVELHHAGATVQRSALQDYRFGINRLSLSEYLHDSIFRRDL